MGGNGWHLGPMVCLDFESTGLDIENDRIVTACVGLVDGTGNQKPETIDVVINPGIPIPDQAAEIHGWTTEKVQAYDGAMTPADGIRFIIDMLAAALTDEPTAPLVGHNLGGYDLSLLDRECRRHGVALLPDRVGADRPVYVVDTFVISKRYDPRRRRVSPVQGAHTLKTCAQVLGIEWDDEQAHGSTYDALMAARVAWLMAHRNPQLARMPIAELHASQVRWKKEQALSYAGYLRGRGEDASAVDESWPVRPYEGQQALIQGGAQ